MLREPIVIDSTCSDEPNGRIVVNTDDVSKLHNIGIKSVTDFLNLTGEVISGHPDRHVMRVELPGFNLPLYLKRQHQLNRWEGLRNWLAGYGWITRCEREGVVLRQLAAAGLPGPRFIASGSDKKRAFLLVEEIPDSVELRQVLSLPSCSSEYRRRLARQIGELIAKLHAGGFTTPDLTAKHVMVTPGGVRLIDWQSSQSVQHITFSQRVQWLAKLHASVPSWQATWRERCRVLWAAFRFVRESGQNQERFCNLARRIDSLGRAFQSRRSISDQRHAKVKGTQQRLVWLADEAICAIPEIAKIWPNPPVSYPYYFADPGSIRVELPSGQIACLIRGRSVAPLARMAARVTGRPWRSPGVTMGRLLFHLERYGIPAPKLLAFGQRFTGFCTAEWFVLHTLPSPACSHPNSYQAAQVGATLRRLHDAGCRMVGYPLSVFGVEHNRVCVRDVTGIQLASSIADSVRERELGRLLDVLPPVVRLPTELSYRQGHPCQSTSKIKAIV